MAGGYIRRKECVFWPGRSLLVQAEEVIDFEGEAGEAMLPNATYFLRSSKLNLACFTLTDDLFCHNL